MGERSAVSRRAFLKMMAGVGSGLALVRCGPAAAPAPGPTATTAPAAAPAPTATAAPAARIGGTLSLLTWEGYDNPEAAKPFYDKYGVTPNATYIGNNDEVLTKYQAGGPGRYDAGDINARYIPPMIEQNMIVPLDLARLPSVNDLYSQFRNEKIVPWAFHNGQMYGAPAYFGFAVINYNADHVKEPPASWEVLHDPMYKGKIGFYDNPTGVMLLIAIILGFGGDATEYTKDQLRQIVEWGKKWKANSKTLIKSYGEMADLLVRGDIWIGAEGWEYVTALGQSQGANLAHTLPEGPAKAWCDCYFIFNGATNPDTAYAWINHMLSPEVMADTGQKVSSLVTNAKAPELMPEEHVKGMGYAQLQAQLDRATWAVLPVKEATSPDQITLDDMLKGYEEIIAS